MIKTPFPPIKNN